VWELVAIAMPQCNSGYEGKHMFANMSLGKRLTVSFTLVIALMAILASLAYVRINSLNAEFSTIITDRYPKTAVANEIKVQINEISRAMLSILIMEDPGQIKGEVDKIEKAASASRAWATTTATRASRPSRSCARCTTRRGCRAGSC
jgi:phosphoglycerate-specific signal transduction histidine kinase